MVYKKATNTNRNFLLAGDNPQLGGYMWLSDENYNGGQYPTVQQFSNDSVQNETIYYGTTGGTIPVSEPKIYSFEKSSSQNSYTTQAFRSATGVTANRIVNTFNTNATSYYNGIPSYWIGSAQSVFGGESNSQVEFAEIIIYGCTTTNCNTVKTTTEKNKIESYLAMKYGVTLKDATGAPQNYVSSANATVWSAATAASTYIYRTSFIARDDVSALNKIVSQPMDFSSQVLSISGASDLEDKEFASVSDNNAQVTTPISSNSPAAFQQRLSRTWQFQTAGGDGVGTVNLVFNLNKQTALPIAGAPTTYKLLLDSDDDFTSGTTISNIVPTVSAGVVTFANVPQANLPTGTRIAIGQPGAALTYSASTWTEATANTGTIDVTTPVTITLTGDTFPAAVVNATNLTATTHYTVANLPTGISLALRKDSSTQLTVLVTGTAASHVNADDVANFQILFTGAAFTSAALPAYVVDYDKDDLAFDFADPNGANIEFSAASAASTNEATANNFPTILVSGTLSSPQTVDVIVSGGTASPLGVDYTHGTLNVLTVSIPAGTYDGTTATDIVITAPSLNNDIAGEGGETIIL